MSYKKILQDLVDELSQYDEKFHQSAVKVLLPVLDNAEQDRADSQLSRKDRRAARHERTLAIFERKFGTAAADELRWRVAAIRRGDLDGL